MKEFPLSSFLLPLDQSFKETTRELLDMVAQIFNARAYSLILALKETEPVIALHHGLSEEYIHFLSDHMQELPGKISYEKGKIRIFKDIKKGTHPVFQALGKEGIRSYVTLPIGWSGKTYGVLTLYFEKKQKFKEKTMKNLEIIVSAVSSALRNYVLSSNLLESQETLKTIFQRSPAGIFIIQDHKYRMVNPAFERITGYTEEEAARMFFWDLVHPDFKEEVKERGLRRERGEKVLPDLYELKIIKKNGEERWILLRATPIKYQGRLANLGIAFDITEEKKLMEELHYLQENLRTIYENSVMGIYLLNAESLVYEMVNPMGKQILRMDIEGKSAGEIFPPDEVFKIQEIVNYIKKTKKSLTTVEKYHTGMGERQIFVSRAPVIGKDGKVKKIVGIFRDITEESRAIKDWERRADLSMMEKLIEVVSRELNNILSIILATSEIGLESGIDEANWKRVRDKAKEAQEFIFQLMEIGKGGRTGRTTIELNEFLKSMLYLLEKIVIGDVILKFKPHHDPLYVVTNPSGLKSAITHLVVNAKEAIEKNGNIEIILGREEEFAFIEVKDTGRGMTEMERERAFDPFFSTKSLETGAGLGLTFVKKFSEKSGGKVRIESIAGMGTSVKMYLPISSTPLKKENIEEAAPSLPEVLLVEDDPDVRKVEKELLTVLGYKVTEVPSGEEALEVVKKQHTPILITDLSMPGIGGAELGREVKRISPNTKVLLISGFVSEEEMEKFKQMGIDAVLHKPFGLEELRKALDSLA